MDSHNFFFKDFEDEKTKKPWKQIFKNKTGIYVIEQPLIKYKKQRIFKVGMADQAGLTRRLADYTTAYGPASFVIHLLWAIPKVVGAIPRLQYNVEQHIHKSLIASNKRVSDKAKEWFIDLPLILALIYKIKDAFEDELIVDKKKTEWYFKDFTDVNVRLKRAVNLSNPENVLIQTPKGYVDLFVIDRDNVRRKADKKRRYLGNEIYIGTRRIEIGLYNKNKNMYEVKYEIPDKGDEKYMTEAKILRYKKSYVNNK
jgi:alkyl hydroperoxide reductase subunit AhpC